MHDPFPPYRHMKIFLSSRPYILPFPHPYRFFSTDLTDFPRTASIHLVAGLFIPPHSLSSAIRVPPPNTKVPRGNSRITAITYYNFAVFACCKLKAKLGSNGPNKAEISAKSRCLSNFPAVLTRYVKHARASFAPVLSTNGIELTSFPLAIVRLAEPIALTSIFPYAWSLVRHFHFGNEQDASFYAGVLISAFSLTEALMGMYWGGVSDRVGRKPVLVLGCLGTMLSMIVVGFASNIWIALLGRAFGGLLNGNIGVIQTMVGELVTKPEHERKLNRALPYFYYEPIK